MPTSHSLNSIIYVTGPVKTGHVGTNYTPSLNRPFLKEYLCSVTCTIHLIKYEIKVANFMAIGYQNERLCSINV